MSNQYERERDEYKRMLEVKDVQIKQLLRAIELLNTPRVVANPALPVESPRNPLSLSDRDYAGFNCGPFKTDRYGNSI